MQNAFYFILKTLFVLKVFKFCLDFLIMQKKRLDQKEKLTFKIQTVTINILSNISQIKDKQTMKLGQLIENNNRNIYFKIRQGGQCQTSFLKTKFLKKTLYTIKQVVPVWFHYIWIALKLSYNKGKLHKTLRLLILRHNQFLFLRKGFGNSFPTIFMCDFSTKVFLMLRSTN